MSQPRKSIESLVAQLAEHYDTVDIVLTKHNPEEDATKLIRVGTGNLYARQLEFSLEEFDLGDEDVEEQD